MESMSSYARSASAVAALLLVAGCATSVNPPNTEPPTAAMRAEIQAALADEVPLTLNALTGAAGAFSPGVSASVASPGGAGVALATATDPFACATFGGTNDTDGDGVRDNVGVTFALPACSFLVGTTTVELTGTVRLIDPQPTTPSLAFSLIYQNFALNILPPDASQALHFTFAGTRNLTATATTLALANDVALSRQVGTGPVAQVQHRLAATFATSGAGTITPGQPLPSGTASVAGELQWRLGAALVGLSVSTVTSLTYDATCAQAQQITAGELRATLNDGTYFRIVWTACGVAPTVTFVGATA